MGTLHCTLYTPSIYTGGVELMISLTLRARQCEYLPWTCDHLEKEHVIAIGASINTSSAAFYSHLAPSVFTLSSCATTSSQNQWIHTFQEYQTNSNHFPQRSMKSNDIASSPKHSKVARNFVGVQPLTNAPSPIQN